MDPSNLDTNSLLSTDDVNSMIEQSLQPFAAFFMIFTVITLLLSVVIIVFWILSVVRKRKVQAAILDMHAILHEMNERDKATNAPE